MRAQPSTTLPASFSLLALATLGAALAIGCAPEDPTANGEVDTAEPVDTGGEAVTGGTVANAVSTSCSTSSVKALSMQIIQQGNCIAAGSYAAIPARAGRFQRCGQRKVAGEVL